MYYCDRGCGTPLLLIHGMWGDVDDWAPVMNPLAERFRVIAVDLPGFGRSDAKKEISSGGLASELVRLLDDLQIQELSVAGNSFGGQVAAWLALQAPQRVTKLVLIASGGLRKYSREQIDAALSQRSAGFLIQLSPELRTMLFSRLFFEQGSETQLRYLEKQAARWTQPGYEDYVRRMCRAMRLALEEDLLDRLSEIRMPVLFIQGENDTLVQAEWVKQAAVRFPRGRLVLFERCGHVPQLEQPERFVREITAFLEGRQV